MQTDTHNQIVRQLLMQNNSTSWFLDQTRKVIVKMQKIEKDLSLNEDSEEARQQLEEYHVLHGKLNYLLGKGLFEKRVMSNLKKKILAQGKK